MKDIAKFAGTTLLLLLTLTLVSLVFIQSFMGDYEWLNIALTVVYSLAVLAAMVYDGLQRGTQDCKYAALMERQQRERGHEITAAERARMYRPAKGWAAGFLGMAPLLLIAVVAVACGQEPPVLVTLCVRISQGAVLGIFQYVDGLLPWFYLAAPVVFALCVGIGYMAGPKRWARQVRMMEKAKREKRRRVARVTADHPQRAGVAVLKVFGRIGKDEFGLPSANPAAHGQRAFRLFVLDVVIFQIARQITGRLVHIRLGNLNAHPVIPPSQGKHQRCAAPRHGVADDQLAVMHAHKLA